MSANTKIEWADHTFNPWEGCQNAGPGCDNCYAEARNARFGGGQAVNWGPGAPRRRTSATNWASPKQWNKTPFCECMGCRWRGPDRATFVIHNPAGFHPPVQWTRGCPACRQPLIKAARPRVFCASLADVFDNQAPDEWRTDLATLIKQTPDLDWLLLTKRIGNAPVMLAQMFTYGAPGNVWLGATVVNQREADRDIPKLLATPVHRRFVSIEPMLRPINLTEVQAPGELRVWVDTLRGHASSLGGTGPRHTVPRLDWVICGGESGPGARPMHPDWARSLRNECAATGVPFLFKQWGEWAPPEAVPQEKWSAIHDYVDGAYVMRVGKRAAGRLLDGVTHDGFPS